jgi:DNA-binding MarR family transcriptional regulator
MNKTAELVNEWVRFEEKFKEGTIEEFCRHYLIRQREKKEIGQNFKGVIPPMVDAYLAKLLGTILNFMNVYIDSAVKEIPEIKRADDFYMLNNIVNLGEARKTDIINNQFMELSSGIDLINRLLKAKLIHERIDPKDKRSRLISATDKGERVVKKCYEYFSKTAEITFWGMSIDDKKLCIQLLRGVEIKHSKIALGMRGKTLNEIHEQVTGVKARKTDR